ncbi:hypothetical protein F4823DRAFT_534825 [Ustulina deusta]|nr:hypothetical protein F4823DRAFT_534825 [Ustulina deusta]
MASSQGVAGKPYRRRRHAAASENLDWEPRRGESRHSLPHRTRQPEIQRSDRRKPKYSSHPSRPSEDIDTHSMPPVRLLTRPTTPKSRGRRLYDDDEDDSDDDSEKVRLRGRLRSRSRVTWGATSRATSRAKSRVKSRPTSRSSQSTDSTTIPTPTRSSYAHAPSAPSAPSPRSLSGSSSDDSDDESSDSTQDHRMKARMKERMNGTPDSEPVPNPPSRSRSRHKSRDRIVPEIESATEDSEDQVISRRPRIIVRRSSVSRHRQAHQSRSRSRAPPHHRGPEGHKEEQAIFSPKRAHKKYYHSDVSYSGKSPFSRSRATSTSRVTSHSVGSSSRQSPGKFFQTSSLPQSYDMDPKIRECVACNDRISAKRLARLNCGHRWCEKCLKRRFKLSIEDAQNMPPTCCTEDIIPIKHVNDLFNDDFKRAWNEKFSSFLTRDRNYCPKAKCGEWIRPADLRHHSNGRTSAKCRKCNTEICGDCYNKWHKSRHCPADAATAQFEKVAEEAGWKRCFKCQAMVELKEGCNHMTCRCGAQFCMRCGSKWKACDCPPFNYYFNDDGELGHVQIHVPMVSRERLGGTDGLPRGMGYAPESRRHRGHRNGDRTRRPLQHIDDDDDDGEEDEDDDYLDDIGDVVGIGNPADHFLNNDYRRRAHSAIVPPAPPPAVPLPPPSLTLERQNSGANYVSGVNKARGVRSSSMERRLADRFSEQRQNFKPHRSFGQPVPPLTAPPLGIGHPPLHQPPMGLSPISRRHTMGEDMYDLPFDPRYASHAIPRRATTHNYMDDFAVHAPMGRRRYRQMEQPKPSELAGLTGPGSGMNRVFEWRNHVDPVPPDSQTVA